MATFEEMRGKHRSDSMLTLSFFLLILLVFAFDIHYYNAIRKIANKPAELKVALEESWLVLIITLISPLATYFIGIITIAKRDIYYPIDNLIFKRRLKVERFICEKILVFRSSLTDPDKEGVAALFSQLDNPNKRRQVMSLFYRFIEKPNIVNPELKNQAFVYWGDYFSAMMFVVWGTLAFVGCFAITIIQRPFNNLRFGIIFAVFVLVVITLREILVGKTKKKQFEIPETQISEIHRVAEAELLTELRAEGYFKS